MTHSIAKKKIVAPAPGRCSGFAGGISDLLDAARRGRTRAVKAFVPTADWETGRPLEKFGQGSEKQAGQGDAWRA